MYLSYNKSTFFFDEFAYFIKKNFFGEGDQGKLCRPSKVIKKGF